MITKFKLFETGEWSRDVNWQFVKDHPDDNSEEAVYIKNFFNDLKILIKRLNNKDIFKILDIRGLDMYQGPYATVRIFNRTYKMWNTQEDDLWIENFPIDNTSEEGKLPGFQESKYQIAELLNDINDAGGDIETYKNSIKFNI